MMKLITEFLSNLQSPRSKYEVKHSFMCRTNSVVNTVPGSALISDLKTLDTKVQRSFAKSIIYKR